MRKKLLLLTFILIIITALIVALPTIGYASSTNDSSSTQARETLSNYDKALYDQLFDKITALKSTNAEQSTVFEIDPSDLGGAKYSWSSTDIAALPAGSSISNLFLEQFNVESVIQALMHDLPLDMYWYDKTTGSIKSLGNDGRKITSFKVIMTVTSPHRGDNYVFNDTTKKPTVKGVNTTYNTTYNNAMEYVNSRNGLSDYAKISAYVEDICGLVSYENSVTDPSYSGAYTDVWQPTYVFDKDNSTNVVCEGYAKALQLLCNLSTFDNLTCYTISGTTTGGHMWNIINIDGKSYMLDVTNSDSGTIGSDGSLILAAPSSGSYNTSYTFVAQGTITYVYNDNVKSMWGSDILTLATSDYTPPAIEFTLTQNAPSDGFTYNGEELTIGNNSLYDIYYTISGSSYSYNWNYEYFKDNNGSMGTELSSAPKDAGTYWIKVTATSRFNSSESGSTTIKVVINPKTLTLSSLELEDKSYDKTTDATLKNATLSGIIGSDIVQIDTTRSVFGLQGSDAATYNYAYVKEFVFTGTNAHNYTHNYMPTTLVPLSSPVVVSKSDIPTNDPIFEYVTNATTSFNDFQFTVTGNFNGSNENGTITWYDDGSEIFDLTNYVEQGKTYTWVLSYDNSNFNDSTGSLVIYPTATLYKVTAISQNNSQGTVSINRENYLSGESVTVTANPKQGYQFDCWVVNGSSVSTSSTYTFTVSNSVNVEARFKSTSSGGSTENKDTLTTIIDIVKAIIPYLPYIIIGGGVIGLIILIALYVKISKSAKKKKLGKNRK